MLQGSFEGVSRKIKIEGVFQETLKGDSRVLQEYLKEVQRVFQETFFSRMLQRSFVLQFCCCIDLIAVT